MFAVSWFSFDILPFHSVCFDVKFSKLLANSMFDLKEIINYEMMLLLGGGITYMYRFLLILVLRALKFAESLPMLPIDFFSMKSSFRLDTNSSTLGLSSNVFPDPYPLSSDLQGEMLFVTPTFRSRVDLSSCTFLLKKNKKKWHNVCYVHFIDLLFKFQNKRKLYSLNTSFWNQVTDKNIRFMSTTC